MTMRVGKWLGAVAVTAGLVLGSAALAKPMKKLPADYTFPQTGDSPGKVTFRHGSHVDEAKPNCLACHPRPFKILEKGKSAEKLEWKHGVFEKGKLCGKCHDGKLAFAMTDSCDSCHEVE